MYSSALFIFFSLSFILRFSVVGALGGHVCRASPLPPLHSRRRVTTGNSPVTARNVCCRTTTLVVCRRVIVAVAAAAAAVVYK